MFIYHILVTFFEPGFRLTMGSSRGLYLRM